MAGKRRAGRAACGRAVRRSEMIQRANPLRLLLGRLRLLLGRRRAQKLLLSLPPASIHAPVALNLVRVSTSVYLHTSIYLWYQTNSSLSTAQPYVLCSFNI